MCGDVADMSWMADMGHTVVGVEISPVAIEQFFNENEIRKNRIYYISNTLVITGYIAIQSRFM
jgi:thiopurine S-methyltransferase